MPVFVLRVFLHTIPTWYVKVLWRSGEPLNEDLTVQAVSVWRTTEHTVLRVGGLMARGNGLNGLLGNQGHLPLRS